MSSKLILRTIYSCKYYYNEEVIVSFEPDRVECDTKVIITCTRNGSYIWGTHVDACIYADCGWDSIISNYFFQYGMSNKLKYISREFSLSLNEKVYPSSMHCIIRDNDGVRCNALYILEDSGIDKQFFCNCDFNNVLALKSIVESVFTTEFNRYQQIRF